jgi:hypothetical protein
MFRFEVKQMRVSATLQAKLFKKIDEIERTIKYLPELHDATKLELVDMLRSIWDEVWKADTIQGE